MQLLFSPHGLLISPLQSIYRASTQPKAYPSSLSDRKPRLSAMNQSTDFAVVGDSLYGDLKRKGPSRLTSASTSSLRLSSPEKLKKLRFMFSPVVRVKVKALSVLCSGVERHSHPLPDHPEQDLLLDGGPTDDSDLPHLPTRPVSPPSPGQQGDRTLITSISLPSSSGARFEPPPIVESRAAMADPPMNVEDRHASAIGKLILTEVRSHPGVQRLKTSSKFFLDTWLDKFGSSSDKINGLNVNMMCSLATSAKVRFGSPLVQPLFLPAPSLSPPKSRASTPLRSSQANVPASMSGGEQDKSSRDDYETVRCGLALEALDALIFEAGQENPIFLVIRDSLLPLLFRQVFTRREQAAFTSFSNGKTSSASQDSIIEMMRKTSQGYDMKDHWNNVRDVIGRNVTDHQTLKLTNTVEHAPPSKDDDAHSISCLAVELGEEASVSHPTQEIAQPTPVRTDNSKFSMNHLDGLQPIQLNDHTSATQGSEKHELYAYDQSKSWRQEARDLAKQLDDANHQRHSERRDYAFLSEELEQLRADSELRLAQQVAEFNTKHSFMQSKLDTMLMENKQLACDYDGAKQEISNFAAQSSALVTLQAEKDSCDLALRNMTSTVDELTTELRTRNAQLDALTVANNKLQQSIDESSAAIVNLEMQLKADQSSTAAALSTASALRKEIVDQLEFLREKWLSTVTASIQTKYLSDIKGTAMLIDTNAYLMSALTEGMGHPLFTAGLTASSSSFVLPRDLTGCTTMTKYVSAYLELTTTELVGTQALCKKLTAESVVLTSKLRDALVEHAKVQADVAATMKAEASQRIQQQTSFQQERNELIEMYDSLGKKSTDGQTKKNFQNICLKLILRERKRQHKQLCKQLIRHQVDLEAQLQGFGERVASLNQTLEDVRERAANDAHTLEKQRDEIAESLAQCQIEVAESKRNYEKTLESADQAAKDAANALSTLRENFSKREDRLIKHNEKLEATRDTLASELAACRATIVAAEADASSKAGAMQAAETETAQATTRAAVKSPEEETVVRSSELRLLQVQLLEENKKFVEERKVLSDENMELADQLQAAQCRIEALLNSLEGSAVDEERLSKKRLLAEEKLPSSLKGSNDMEHDGHAIKEEVPADTFFDENYFPVSIALGTGTQKHEYLAFRVQELRNEVAAISATAKKDRALALSELQGFANALALARAQLEKAICEKRSDLHVDGTETKNEAVETNRESDREEGFSARNVEEQPLLHGILKKSVRISSVPTFEAEGASAIDSVRDAVNKHVEALQNMTSPSMLSQPFLSYIRRHEVQYAREIGLMKVMLREFRGFYDILKFKMKQLIEVDERSGNTVEKANEAPSALALRNTATPKKHVASPSWPIQSVNMLSGQEADTSEIAQQAAWTLPSLSPTRTPKSAGKQQNSYRSPLDYFVSPPWSTSSPPPLHCRVGPSPSLAFRTKPAHDDQDAFKPARLPQVINTTLLAEIRTIVGDYDWLAKLDPSFYRADVEGGDAADVFAQVRLIESYKSQVAKQREKVDGLMKNPSPTVGVDLPDPSQTSSLDDVLAEKQLLRALDDLVAKLREQADAQGSWMTLLIKFDGSIDLDMDIAAWPAADQVNILQCKLDYLRLLQTKREDQMASDLLNLQMGLAVREPLRHLSYDLSNRSLADLSAGPSVLMETELPGSYSPSKAVGLATRLKPRYNSYTNHGEGDVDSNSAATQKLRDATDHAMGTLHEIASMIDALTSKERVVPELEDAAEGVATRPSEESVEKLLEDVDEKSTGADEDLRAFDREVHAFDSEQESRHSESFMSVASHSILEEYSHQIDVLNNFASSQHSSDSLRNLRPNSLVVDHFHVVRPIEEYLDSLGNRTVIPRLSHDSLVERGRVISHLDTYFVALSSRDKERVIRYLQGDKRKEALGREEGLSNIEAYMHNRPRTAPNPTRTTLSVDSAMATGAVGTLKYAHSTMNVENITKYPFRIGNKSFIDNRAHAGWRQYELQMREKKAAVLQHRLSPSRKDDKASASVEQAGPVLVAGLKLHARETPALAGTTQRHARFGDTVAEDASRPKSPQEGRSLFDAFPPEQESLSASSSALFHGLADNAHDEAQQLVHKLHQAANELRSKLQQALLYESHSVEKDAALPAKKEAIRPVLAAAMDEDEEERERRIDLAPTTVVRIDRSPLYRDRKHYIDSLLAQYNDHISEATKLKDAIGQLNLSIANLQPLEFPQILPPTTSLDDEGEGEGGEGGRRATPSTLDQGREKDSGARKKTKKDAVGSHFVRKMQETMKSHYGNALHSSVSASVGEKIVPPKAADPMDKLLSAVQR